MEYTIEDYKKATIIKPKPGENIVNDRPDKKRWEYLKHLEVKRLEEELEMVTYDKIRQLGIKLKESDIKTISTQKLMQLLAKATNAHRKETLKHYMILLKDDKIIRFTSEGWEIIRD